MKYKFRSKRPARGRLWKSTRRKYGLANQIKKVKKDLKRVKRDIEYKYNDTKQLSLSISSGGTVQTIGLEQIHELQDENMAAGQATPGPQRDGNKITVSRISIRGRLKVSSTDETNVVRMLLVQYHRTPISWSGPVLTDILSAVSQPEAFYSHYNKEGFYKTKVLYDRVFKLQRNHSVSASSTNYSAVHPQTIFFKIQKKFKKGLIVEYPDKTYVQSNGEPYDNTPNNNNIVLMLISDSTEGTLTGHPVAEWQSRINFTG